MTLGHSTPNQNATNERNVGFATSSPLYRLSPDANTLDVRDQLGARLAQLTSMLQMIHGNGFENFDNWSDDVKDNYLWGCSMLAEECRALERHL